ncbi:unnamed protein product [Wickerhamomyces anomalus]
MTTQTFSYSNDCDLEVHCSPFGISGLYIKLANSDSVDLVNSKFKLFGVLEDEDILRIDFIKILNPKGDYSDDAGSNDGSTSATPKNDQEEQLPSENPGDAGYEIPDLVFRGKVPAGRPDAVEPFIGIFTFEKAPQ